MYYCAALFGAQIVFVMLLLYTSMTENIAPILRYEYSRWKNDLNSSASITETCISRICTRRRPRTTTFVLLSLTGTVSCFGLGHRRGFKSAWREPADKEAESQPNSD